MKIRTQLTLVIVLFGIALLVIAGAIIITDKQVERLGKQQTLAKNIETGANELSYLSGDYVLYRENQQAERWNTRYNALESDLSVLSVDMPGQQVLADNLKADLQRLKNIFDEISSGANNSQGTPAADQAAIQVSWSRLAVQTQGMAFDAGRLSQMIGEEMNGVKGTSNDLILLLMGTFSLFVLVSYLIAYRRTLGAVEDLQKGTRIIGEGDLGYAIEEKGDDEITDLSKAFNRMTVNLREVTASKSDLEREIADRKRAEAEVSLRNEELNAINDELYATQAELHLNIEELGRSERALRESEEKYRNLFTNMTEEVHFWKLIRDSEGRIRTWELVDVNAPALKTWGKKIGDIIGKTIDEIFGPGASEHYLPVVERIMTGGVPYSFEDYFPHLDRYFRFTSVPLGDYFITTGTDITGIKKTEKELIRKNEDLNVVNENLVAINEELGKKEDELREALAEKEVLLSEIHHRVKNNLTALISLLSLEGTYEDTEDGRKLRNDLQNRARSMALIHETLYRTKNYSSIDMGFYLNTLVEQIAATYKSGRNIHTFVDVDGVNIDIARATPCGLIVNELVTNAFKYAFPDTFDCMTRGKEPCFIRVSFAREKGTYILTVRDNGTGLPETIDITASKSLGLKLVNFLAKHQLKATLMIDRGSGTSYTFRFS
jgi:two-component sensor histidine kinase/methyl-accepting chemotaxis protein